ncbi:hypothetical protein CN554_13180 [Bacillus wiedmannii]|uniref:hypothetical protein n=1 Tax=Bacillus wiedmannii TaxID=1890302 RepID=UPI000BF2035E|nr:hypothetical protein [Bacillus wiedmannii]PEO97608.1 hypothetical protein CN554_13180 [Bacillus wiedmannii]
MSINSTSNEVSEHIKNELEIQSKRASLIIPFAFNKEISASKEKLRVHGWEAIELKNKGYFVGLYPHLEHLLENNWVSETIGVCLELKKNYYNTNGLPGNFIETFFDSNEEYEQSGINEFNNLNIEDQCFQINYIRLYLFETKVGFIEVQLRDCLDPNGERQILDECVDEIISLSYTLFVNNITSININGKETIYEGFPRLIERLERSIDIEYFFEQTNGIPYKSLIYFSTTLSYEKLIENRNDVLNEIGKNLYQIRQRNTFVDFALPEELEIDTSNNNVIEFSKNIFSTVSQGGTGRIAFDERRKGLPTFMLDNAFREEGYYLLNLLVLHQRFALLHLYREASKLNKYERSIHKEIRRVDNNKFIKNIATLQESIVLFKLRSDFKQVSNMDRIERYYRFLRTNLKVEELLEELNEETNMLSALIEINLQKKNERIRQQEERKAIEEQRIQVVKDQRIMSLQNYITISTVIFVVFSATADAITVLKEIGWDMMKPTIWGKGFPFWIILFLIIVALPVSTFIVVRRINNELKENTNQNEENN